LRLGYYQGPIKHRISEAGDPFRALHHLNLIWYYSLRYTWLQDTVIAPGLSVKRVLNLFPIWWMVAGTEPH